MDSLPHKPREECGHKFAMTIRPRCRDSDRAVVDMWMHFPTGWGQWGKDAVDAGRTRFGIAFALFSAGEFRQGALVPAFHRANYT